MKAALIQKGDEFWQDEKLVYTVTGARRTGSMIYIRYRHFDGGEGVSIFYADDETPLTSAKESVQQ